mmetsp:Transcript_222/g.270  ORF Transcript_222/g.270 Transcript_222/m.270 type:complete len:274 (-) Transcript_222:66-887(-)
MTSIFTKDLVAGQKFYITGGGSGIGKEIALTVMQHGGDVAIMGRRKNVLEETKAELERLTGKTCIVCQGDVRKVEEVKAAVDLAVNSLGKIDVLVNGAAGNFVAPLDTLGYNAFKAVVDIDLIGTFNVTKAVYERTMKHTGGVIINLSLTMHYNGSIGTAHASAAKAGVEALTKVFAAELGPRNIRVLGISPGPTDETEGMERMGKGLKERIQELVPLGRYAKKSEVAQAVLFATKAEYLTGTIVVLDGGTWLTGSQFTMCDDRVRNWWRPKL